MTFYVLLWAVLLFLATLQGTMEKKMPSSVFCIILFILSIFVVGCRYQVGSDWDSYRTFYYDGYVYDRSSGILEPLFSSIRDICYLIGASHAIFFAVLSLFSLFLLKKTAENFNIGNLYFVLFIYLSMYFCNYQFNIVRQGVLASCVWYGFSEKYLGNTKSALVWILVGCGFHFSGVFFIPILFIITKCIPTKIVLLILFCSYVGFLIGVSDIIIGFFPLLQMFEKVSGYVDSTSQEQYGLSAGMIFNTMLVIYCFIMNKEYNNSLPMRIVLNAILGAIVISCLLNSFSAIVSRIANLLNMALVFFWPIFLNAQKSKFVRFLIAICMLLYLFLYYNISYNSKSGGDSAMLPFQIRIEQLF